MECVSGRSEIRTLVLHAQSSCPPDWRAEATCPLLGGSSHLLAGLRLCVWGGDGVGGGKADVGQEGVAGRSWGAHACAYSPRVGGSGRGLGL
ncbi:unnamed protein product [Gulo gulo]|uniref:Uncharacterized protein n=1 Tax=Gulo gulo TaxID=48420 RepID=A0A9X9Q6Y6_GULGU|nr:unnamed protein product [Gulo gulo]